MQIISHINVRQFSWQRDVTDALIVLSAQGDENKNVFGEAGFTEELLNLVESPDMEVRCNSAKARYF